MRTGEGDGVLNDRQKGVWGLAIVPGRRVCGIRVCVVAKYFSDN